MSELREFIRESEKDFIDFFDILPRLAAVAPGRINIIGEHTDYNEGLSMPAAIDRWIVVNIARRSDKNISIQSADFNSGIKFNLVQGFEPVKTWEKYAFGAVSVFNEVFPIPFGFYASIKGNIPIGSGLSSSAALEVSLMNALRTLYAVKLSDLELIKLCQRVEHEHLNIKSGLLDQFASQFSREGEFLVLDFHTMNHRHFKANMKNWSWVVIDSGVRRELTSSKYMERVQECGQGLKALQDNGVPIKSFRDIKEEHIKAHESETAEKWRKRLRHVLNENRRVEEAENALCKEDFKSLGEILIKSHESLKNDYEVSCEEMDILVSTALSHKNCAGARMMGGGFGGCTLNLVEKKGEKDFGDYVSQVYCNKTGIEAKVYYFKLVDGAKVL